MSRTKYCALSVFGTVLFLVCPQPASAQWGPMGDPCGMCQPAPQVCYQTVPVTEYREFKQTVQQPVFEQKWVEQPCTEYVPVTEQRTCDIPTVCYQDVVENCVRTRDCGAWRTSYYCNPKMAPCQYDPRPGLVGWWNRTTYSIRSSMTPNVIAQRQYVPNIVAYNVPYTRRVAQLTTRKVAYNVTRMVAQTTTRKVAFNTVRYVAKEITQTQPVTVMRTVPIGTTFAYGVVPFGASPQTVIRPTEDPIGGGTRSADRDNDNFQEVKPPEQFNRKSSSLDNNKEHTNVTRQVARPASGNSTRLSSPQSAESQIGTERQRG